MYTGRKMKIGIFSDTYRPSVNGIVYVTEILRRNFEQMGHEVYIFAPSSGLLSKNDAGDPHIIRFPAISGVPYDDFNVSLFFPPRVLKQIEELQLDILHFLTPGPVGLMAMYAGRKLGKPVVAEYCTDIFDYVDHYPLALPSLILLGAVIPFTLRTSREELIEMVKAARPRHPSGWTRNMVKHLVTAVHSHCSAVIVHSRKSQNQLSSWQDDATRHPTQLVPTGVDPLPIPKAEDVVEFRRKWNIERDDDVVAFIGRLSPEKNLASLIPMIIELKKWRPKAKLMYVGDFAEYRPALEKLAKASPAASDIIFTGKIPREELGVAYAAADIFAFPSLTDTQGLVLHEAALAGLPIIMIDEPVSEVVKNGENGYICQNDPIDMAAKARHIFEDEALHKKMSAASKKIASQFSERGQSERIIKIYETVIHSKAAAKTD